MLEKVEAKHRKKRTAIQPQSLQQAETWFFLLFYQIQSAEPQTCDVKNEVDAEFISS